MCSYRLPVIIMLIILSIDMYFTFFDSISWKITVLSFNVWAYTLLNKIKIIKKNNRCFFNVASGMSLSYIHQWS